MVLGENLALLPVRLQSTWLMLQASLVREVLGAQPLLTVPRSDAHLSGLCVWRGRAIPVVNLEKLLGVSESNATSEPAPHERMLVLEVDANLVAVPASEVRAVTIASQAELRPVHVTSLAFSDWEVDVGEMVASVVDMNAVLSQLSNSLGRGGGAGAEQTR